MAAPPRVPNFAPMTTSTPDHPLPRRPRWPIVLVGVAALVSCSGPDDDGGDAPDTELAWVPVAMPASPPARAFHAMAYDAARDRAVVFGGGADLRQRSDTWEWDGQRWLDVSPLAGAPPPRTEHAMAYDAARERVVLFGGWNRQASSSTNLGDTWVWDGDSWLAGTLAEAPPPRAGHAMAYDAARERVVLFGGYSWDGTGQVEHLDTWEWDGQQWHQAASLPASSAGYGSAMAYDAARERVVLFTGDYDYHTYEWDGQQWLEMAPAVSPPARRWHEMAYDAAREQVVVFGGDSELSAEALADTWAWDGQQWLEVTPEASPPGRLAHAMAYDAAQARVVLFGGFNPDGDTQAGDDTWAWDGQRWDEVTPAGPPSARSAHAIAHDAARARTVLFGGRDHDGLRSDTWEWDGETWRRLSPSQGPSARENHVMAYDAGRARVVLFGGAGLASNANDTWTWDGQSWELLTPPTSPPARAWSAMAYDDARERVVLFGGTGPAGYTNDTWTWDGQSWQLHAPPTSPPARALSAMAYDDARERLVLFGGARPPPADDPWLGDTWEWDGEEWLEVTPADSPPPTMGHALAYDPALGQVVLFGGATERPYPNDLVAHTWAWDGARWQQLTPHGAVPVRRGLALALDALRGRVVLFGGLTRGQEPLGDTWELVSSLPTSRVAP
jgi:hypothetical protein